MWLAVSMLNVGIFFLYLSLYVRNMNIMFKEIRYFAVQQRCQAHGPTYPLYNIIKNKPTFYILQQFSIPTYIIEYFKLYFGGILINNWILIVSKWVIISNDFIIVYYRQNGFIHPTKQGLFCLTTFHHSSVSICRFCKWSNQHFGHFRAICWVKMFKIFL